jgi:hypothetical protein
MKYDEIVKKVDVVKKEEPKESEDNIETENIF